MKFKNLLSLSAAVAAAGVIGFSAPAQAFTIRGDLSSRFELASLFTGDGNFFSARKKAPARSADRVVAKAFGGGRRGAGGGMPSFLGGPGGFGGAPGGASGGPGGPGFFLPPAPGGNVAVAPIPATAPLLLAALVGGGLIARRRRAA